MCRARSADAAAAHRRVIQRESPEYIEYPHGVTDVTARVARVRARIAEAATRRGRRPEEVTLVAVTKGVDLPRIQEALASGITDLGENRVQEAASKVPALGRIVQWHMVGHLQRNKVRQAVSLFHVVHSVDSMRLASELDRYTSTPLEVLVQVNVAGEGQKFGLAPDEVTAVVPKVAALSGLRVVGLMTIAPQTTEPETVRPVFRQLRQLRDALRTVRVPGLVLAHLSMGMTDDFEVAIEEGATMVRIGRAIFGERR